MSGQPLVRAFAMLFAIAGTIDFFLIARYLRRRIS
jgi:hypothetical protein